MNADEWLYTVPAAAARTVITTVSVAVEATTPFVTAYSLTVMVPAVGVGTVKATVAAPTEVETKDAVPVPVTVVAAVEAVPPVPLTTS